MKLIRIIVLLAFTGPMLVSTADACCSMEKAEHAEAVVIDACTADVHVEAADASCHDEPCAECTLCHAQSSSFITHQTSFQIPVAHQLVSADPSTFTEIVSSVLTPPPTL